MLPHAQKAVLTEVIKTWSLDRSNYVLVCPPMNGERRLIDFLTSEKNICEIIGSHYHNLSIASLDTSNFKTELVFARSVARGWGVDDEIGIDDDPRAILELACAAVTRLKRSPILIIHRFHEALDKLGEDIGSALRDLEHSHNLKTVVTMPVSLTVLRERWEAMDSNKAPFLASDWGQGHRNKVLKGYSCSEIVTLGESKKVDGNACKTLFRATGGIVDIVNILIEEIGGKKGVGLTLYLQQRSTEVCKRVLDWLDPINTSHTYKKALVSLLNPSFYPTAFAFIMDHDWNTILLNKDGSLNFEMLAWGAASTVSRSTDTNWADTLKQLYRDENYDAAIAMIEVMYGADKANSNYWLTLRDVTFFCKYTNDVFSSSGQWTVARRKLTKLLDNKTLPVSVVEAFAGLSTWIPITELLSDFLSKKTVQPDLRIENFICMKDDRSSVLPFLQLLVLRLHAAQKHDTFQSLQSVMTAPESLLQIYAYFELKICFWKFSGLPDKMAEKLEIMARKPYRITGEVLGYSDLAHLIALYGEFSENPACLISSRDELDDVLKKYEVRKENSHSTAFTGADTCQQYRDFLGCLLERYLKNYSVAAVDAALVSPKSCALGLLEFAPRSPLSV